MIEYTVQVYGNGKEIWRKDGLLHREGDKPAITLADGTKKYYIDNAPHRDGDLPAIEYADGTKKYYKDDLLHRDDDKPAIEYADGTKYYYKNGVRYTPRETITVTMQEVCDLFNANVQIKKEDI